MASNLSGGEKLSAISWAAKEAGTSYGKYEAMLTEKEKEKIYDAFAEVLERRKIAETERLNAAQIEKRKKKRKNI